jgi:hypothetical protein
MIDASMIPDEVVEVAAKAICKRWGYSWKVTSGMHDGWRKDARAAFAAALNAWPGVWECKYHGDGSLAILLPLPKDAADE